MNLIWAKVKPWAWRIGQVCAFATVLATTIYWIRFAPVVVESHIVKTGLIVAEVMGTGTLEARTQATISPEISGRIAKVAVDQGDRVETGTLLVRFEDQELQQQVAIAQANLDTTTAAIKRLVTDKDRAVAIYSQAEKTNERTLRLLNNNAVSHEEADKASEAFAIAAAGVSSASAAISVGQKELVAAEKTLEYQRARLQDAQIFAPFDGLIIKRYRESGDVAVPGSSILTIVSTEELWISLWVDETEMARLHPEQAARVVFRSESDKSYPGVVVRLGKEADRETREFVVDVRVVELPKNWAIGQRAEAYIEVGRKSEALLLPARFLAIRDRDTGVFVNADGVAKWRTVTTGLRSQDQVEILNGLAAGDIVIISDDARKELSDGKNVTAR